MGNAICRSIPQQPRKTACFSTFCMVSFSCNRICLHLCTCSEMSFFEKPAWRKQQQKRTQSFLLLINDTALYYEKNISVPTSDK